MRPALLSWLLATLLMLSFGASGSRAHAAPDPKWPDPQRETPDQLDRFVSAKVDELNLPGLAVVVVAEVKVLVEGTYGEASPGVPVSLDTPFRLGSTSKQFTGLAVQQLIAQGRLSLDTPVGAALPEVGQNAAWSTTAGGHHCPGGGRAPRHRPPDAPSRRNVRVLQRELHAARRDHRAHHRSAVRGRPAGVGRPTPRPDLHHNRP